jgi:hypothetical protein
MKTYDDKFNYLGPLPKIESLFVYGLIGTFALIDVVLFAFGLIP